MRAPGLLAAFLMLVGCDGKSCPEPWYDGAAHEVSWQAMVDAEARATTNDAQAVKLSFPTDGEKLNGAGPPPTFTWTTPLVAARLARPSTALGMNGVGVAGWLYGSAWAHGAAVTGPIHFLRITVPKRTCPFEVLTTKTQWIPSAAAWNELKTFTSGTLSLDVFSAYLVSDRVSEGPFHFTKPISITVSK